jgi:hypothetical protein
MLLRRNQAGPDRGFDQRQRAVRAAGSSELDRGELRGSSARPHNPRPRCVRSIKWPPLRKGDGVVEPSSVREIGQSQPAEMHQRRSFNAETKCPRTPRGYRRPGAPSAPYSRAFEQAGVMEGAGAVHQRLAWRQHSSLTPIDAEGSVEVKSNGCFEGRLDRGKHVARTPGARSRELAI